MKLVFVSACMFLLAGSVMASTSSTSNQTSGSTVLGDITQQGAHVSSETMTMLEPQRKVLLNEANDIAKVIGLEKEELTSFVNRYVNTMMEINRMNAEQGKLKRSLIDALSDCSETSVVTMASLNRYNSLLWDINDATYRFNRWVVQSFGAERGGRLLFEITKKKVAMTIANKVKIG